MSSQLIWNKLESLSQFERVVDSTTQKPALIFKHRKSSEESIQAKNALEQNWMMASTELDCYLVDVMEHKDVALEVGEIAGVPNEFPQVLIFADGVTMYDESHELISVKKIKLALKIINRTFKWMETRV